MKATVSTLLCLVVLLTACKKNQVNKIQPSITGTWELRSSFGPIANSTQTYPPGNGNLITFTDASYSYYNSGSLASQGNFKQGPNENGDKIFDFTSGYLSTGFEGVLHNDTLTINVTNVQTTLGGNYVQVKTDPS